jgi:hypothetical protein
MHRLTRPARVLVLALALAAAITSSSCDGPSGVGVGVTSRGGWGGSVGPPVFVGGPSF